MPSIQSSGSCIFKPLLAFVNFRLIFGLPLYKLFNLLVNLEFILQVLYYDYDVIAQFDFEWLLVHYILEYRVILLSGLRRNISSVGGSSVSCQLEGDFYFTPNRIISQSKACFTNQLEPPPKELHKRKELKQTDCYIFV